MIMQSALLLHILGTIVWVGGMFFAHMALRPAANDLLDPPQRLPLLHRVLSAFFPWVWLSIASILISGFWIFLVLWSGQANLYVHVMMGIGLLMVCIFCYIYFLPFRLMGLALEQRDFSSAGARMAVIRRLIGTNLVLGLITSTIAVVGRLF